MGEPGAVVEVSSAGIRVRCGDGSFLRLTEIQAEGKKKMSAQDFARGQRLEAGERCGD